MCTYDYIIILMKWGLGDDVPTNGLNPSLFWAIPPSSKNSMEFLKKIHVIENFKYNHNH